MVLNDISAKEFFDGLLNLAEGAQRCRVSPQAHSYLLGLLADPGTGPAGEKLGDRFNRAVHAPTPSLQGRNTELRQLGDDALLLTGFFWTRILFSRSASWRRYYMDVGRQSYAMVGGELFDELSVSFDLLVEVFMQISGSCGTQQDLLRMIDAWHATHSRYVAAVLARQGVSVAALTFKAPS